MHRSALERYISELFEASREADIPALHSVDLVKVNLLSVQPTARKPH